MLLLVLILSCHDYFKGFEQWNKVCKFIVVPHVNFFFFSEAVIKIIGIFFTIKYNIFFVIICEIY